MSDKNFKVGDLVWAKMKSYPYWPAKIVTPPPKIKVPSSKKAQHCVRFFGSGDYGWITLEFLAHHSEDMVLKSKKGSKKISVALQNAIDEITKISKNTYDNATSPINGEFDNEEMEVEETSPNPSPQIIEKKVRKKKKSEILEVEKDNNEPEEMENEDDEPEEVEKNDDEPEEVEKDDDEPEEVEKDDDEPEEVGKDDNEPEEVEKDDDEPEEVENDDDEPEEVENDDDEPEEVEKDDDEPEVEKDDDEPEVERDDDELEEVEKDDIEKGENETEETNREGSSSDESHSNYLSKSSSEESITDAENGENEESNSETSEHSVEKNASKVKKKVDFSRKRVKPNKLRKRRSSSPVETVLYDLPPLRSYIERPPTPVLDIMKVSEFLNSKNVVPTQKKIGFLGLGMIGRGVVKNLLHSGHNVTVWNRTPSKCDPFVKAGALKGLTPADVVASCDVTFCCVSDSMAVKNLVFESCGVLKGFEGCTALTKGYVEMTSIDPVTSLDVCKGITSLGGRYLEAPIIGSRQLADQGALLSLVAGDRELFNDCFSCFFAFTRNVYYLSNIVGYGSKMNLIQSMLYGTTAAALAEAMALVESCHLPQHKFLEILSMGPLSCPLVRDKGSAMTDKDFTTNTALKHQLKDLNLVLQMSDGCRQSTTTTSAANQLYKRARVLNYLDHDVSAVIMGAK